MNLADPQAWKKVQNGSFKPVDKLLNTPAVKLTNIPAITASSNLKLEKPVNKQSNKAVFFKEMGFSKPKIVEPILLKPQQGPSKKELERQQALMENDEDFVDLPMNEQTGIDLNSASQKYGY